MENTKHTPGPWAWQQFGDYRLLTAQHGTREIIIGSIAAGMKPVKTGPAMNSDGLLEPVDPNHPNAKLIASAPELLEALDNLTFLIKHNEEKGIRTDTECAEYEKAIAAISKATA